MGKTIIPVPNATRTIIEVDSIVGLDDHVSNHPDVSAATIDRHTESHTIPSHSDTNQSGSNLDELTDGSTTELHKHQIDIIDGGSET